MGARIRRRSHTNPPANIESHGNFITLLKSVWEWLRLDANRKVLIFIGTGILTGIGLLLKYGIIEKSSEKTTPTAPGSVQCAPLASGANAVNITNCGPGTLNINLLDPKKLDQEIDERIEQHFAQRFPEQLDQLRSKAHNAVTTIDEMTRQSNGPQAEAIQAKNALARGDTLPTQKLLHHLENEALTRSDPSSAAELARQQGALAFLSDATAALADYKRAAKYEPDNPETLISVGDLQEAIGQPIQAADTFKKTAAALETKLKSDPRNTEWQRDLALVHERIGAWLVKHGDPEGALTEYRQALATLLPLSQENLDKIDWQRDLAATRDRIGRIYLKQNNPASAIVEFSQGLAIIEPLALRQPDNVELQVDRAAGYMRLGEALKGQGDLSGALSKYKQAVLVSESLATNVSARDISASTYSLDETRAESHLDIGIVLAAQDDIAGALVEFQQALNIVESQASRDPRNADWQKDIMQCLNYRGQAFLKLGEQREALADFRHALTIAEGLAKADPKSSLVQHNVAASHSLIGKTLAMTGNPRGAREEIKRGIAILELQLSRDPTNNLLQQDLSSAQMDLATLGFAQ